MILTKKKSGFFIIPLRLKQKIKEEANKDTTNEPSLRARK